MSTLPDEKSRIERSPAKVTAIILMACIFSRQLEHVNEDEKEEENRALIFSESLWGRLTEAELQEIE